MTIGFVSVFEDETGDIEFQDTDFKTARINQASSENIGIFLLKKNEFVFEARGNYNELIRSLAQQTDFQRYDTPNN